MSDGLIKLCGFSNSETALVAGQAGADLIGFVFAESRRRVSPALVAEIAAEVRNLDDPPILVGLFANELPAEINSIAAEAGVDYVQVLGIADPIDLNAIERPTIVQLRTEPGLGIDELAETMESMLKGNRPPLWFILDGYKAGQLGGTGELADWAITRQLADRFPVMLAGGLNPDNVAAAIQMVTPYGVDTSSGLEIDGAKDPGRIEAFVTNARSAFCSLC